VLLELPPRLIDPVRRAAVTLSHARSATDGRAVYIERLSMAARETIQRAPKGPHCDNYEQAARGAQGPRAASARSRHESCPRRRSTIGFQAMSQDSLVVRASPRFRKRRVPSAAQSSHSGRRPHACFVRARLAVLLHVSADSKDLLQNIRQLRRSIQSYGRTFIEHQSARTVSPE
jgi:hypothetical protein